MLTCNVVEEWFPWFLTSISRKWIKPLTGFKPATSGSWVMCVTRGQHFILLGRKYKRFNDAKHQRTLISNHRYWSLYEWKCYYVTIKKRKCEWKRLFIIMCEHKIDQIIMIYVIKLFQLSLSNYMSFYWFSNGC